MFSPLLWASNYEDFFNCQKLQIVEYYKYCRSEKVQFVYTDVKSRIEPKLSIQIQPNVVVFSLNLSHLILYLLYKMNTNVFQK